MDFDTIIGIDPGASGGIAVYRLNTPLKAVKMPKDINDFKEFLEYWQSIGKPIVFIEKLSIRPDDIMMNGEKANMGKMFRIQKMTGNYEALKTTMQIIGMPYVMVHPMKWQNGLKLRIKGEEKADRKKRYKDVAQNIYPEVKATMWNCDALLIMHFGRMVIKSNPKYLTDNLSQRITQLFQGN